jgi:hypothetical protein
MKELLKKIDAALQGFRGLLAIWVPIIVAYCDTLFMGLTSISKDGLIMAAQLAIIPTVKLIWTDAIPKMIELYHKWLNS